MGRFIIKEVFESMEIVYHVCDCQDPSRHYAAKGVKPDHVYEQEILDLFSRQAKIWYLLNGDFKNHPNIVKMIEHSRLDVDGACYFFTEYVEGKTLLQIMEDPSANQISYPQALVWATQIAEGMEYASRQDKNGQGVFVHRDLHASNIMITREGLAKINDWGIGKNLLELGLVPFRTIHECQGRPVGRPSCMPPEMFPPDRGMTYGVPGDVYFFGGLLFNMLTGESVNPEQESSWMQRNPNISKDAVCERLDRHHRNEVTRQLREQYRDENLVHFVMECINVDVNKRIGNFTTVLKRLGDLCRELKRHDGPGKYFSCPRCSFITSQTQSICPVCEHTVAFRPWNTRQMECLDEDFIHIPEGEAILGVHHETLARLIQEYGLSGGQLEQFSTPDSHRIFLPEFEIARCAVTNKEYAEFIRDTRWPRTITDAIQLRSGGLFGADDEPVVMVNFNDAEAFCQWKGARLPTNDEWERAARGKGGFAYPWGNDWQPMGDAFPCNCAEFRQTQAGELVPVSAFHKYASPDGVLNMAGNVWEWVDGGEGDKKHVRGGCFNSQGDVFTLTWFRMPADPDLRDNETGFRCARDVEKHHVSGDGSPPSDLDLLIPISAGAYQIGATTQQIGRLALQFKLSAQDTSVLARNSSRTVSLKRFRIRKHLVTNEEYYQFVQDTRHPWPGFWSAVLANWSGRPFLARYRFHPVTRVSYTDASAFCKWRRVRLPTDDEWEAAARGETDFLYPWGDEFSEDRCNCLEFGLARTSKVNDFPSGASPTGCLDMGGNVMEWVSPESGRQFSVRGGSFQEKGGLYALTVLKIAADPEVTSPEIGFRYVLTD